MGMDATAILFWGIVFTDDDEIPRDFADDVYEALDADQKRDVPEPSGDDYKSGEWAAWRERRDAWERGQCDLGRCGSCDDASYFARPNAAEIKVDWGDATEIKSLEVDPTWEPKLRTFCERFGLPWREPRWWLVAYYG